MPSKEYKRLDEILVERGLAKNLKEAQGKILAGKVLVENKRIYHAGKRFPKGISLEIKKESPYVSRGGEKLEKALSLWNFPVKDSLWIDIGASTGGFTDLLLQKGAKKVIALDVGYGLLHPRLREDPRVYPLERTHILSLKWEDLPFSPMYFCMDLSFISSKKVLLYIKRNFPLQEGILLFKPQFEAPSSLVEKGIITKEEVLSSLLEEFIFFLQEENIFIKGFLPSFIKGAKGNQEYFFWLLLRRG